MGLSSIMSGANLATYAEIALIIFFAVFMVVVVRTMRKSRDDEFDRAARIPLEDDPVDPIGGSSQEAES